MLELFSGQSDASKKLQECKEYLHEYLPELVEDISLPSLWYVMQGRTFNEEQGKKYLWAPLRNNNGTTFSHWSAVADLKVNDIIVHHADGANDGTD